MTADELGRMTIADLESAAARVAAALAVLREAGAWAPRTASSTAAPVATAVPAPPLAQETAAALSATELSERRALLRRIRGEDLPPEIAALERTS
jgi:hypothetical protein